MSSVSPVTIILPFYNQLEYTKSCLSSIRTYTHYPHEIIAVDNGSRDGSCDWIKQNCEGIRIIANKKNTGAQHAFNQGIKASDGKYILLLNNDTIVTEGWLAGLVSGMDDNIKNGIVGPSTNPHMSGGEFFPDVDGFRNVREIQRTAAAISLARRGRLDNVPGITSFCMLIRRRLIEEIGLFDEGYGLGTNDDHDFCLRTRIAGYRIMCAMGIFVFHFYSRTLGGLNMVEIDRKNRDYFVSKFGEKAVRYLAQIGQPYSDTSRK
jgi:GT2 family glycosyltransferase